MNTAVRLAVGAAAGLALVALVVAVVALRAQPRVGYIDVDELLEAYPPAVAVRQAIEEELAPMRVKLDDHRRATEDIAQRFAARREQLSDSEVVVLQQSLLMAKQRQVELERNLEVARKKLESERMKPVYDELDASMETFGADGGYTIVFAPTRAGNLVYTSDGANVTDDLLAWLAQNPPASP